MHVVSGKEEHPHEGRSEHVASFALRTLTFDNGPVQCLSLTDSAFRR
jgi:hypothetical protein